MKWETDILRYTCMIVKDRVKLMIPGYNDTQYPLSYTFQECIEEFCDRMGWGLNIATQDQQYPPGRVTGLISLQRQARGTNEN